MKDGLINPSWRFNSTDSRLCQTKFKTFLLILTPTHTHTHTLLSKLLTLKGHCVFKRYRPLRD